MGMSMHNITRVFGSALVAFTLAAACTEPSGGGGITGESHVVHLDVSVTGGTACFDVALADVDSTTPGPQYECAVSDVRNAGMPNEVETILPACNNVMAPASSTNRPCWSVQVDTASCTVSPSLALVIERNEAPATTTRVVADCVSES
jgi:hypothetical protein